MADASASSTFQNYQKGLLGSDAFGHGAPLVQGVDAISLWDQARRSIFDYVKNRLEKTDNHVTFTGDEVYIVWFVKVLQNWKALVSTTLPDGMYYEVTYDGDKKATYIDAYKKFDNVRVPDEVSE